MIEFMKRLCGHALNAVGTPGFIQRHDCQSRLGITVEVRVTDRFTIIAVNNMQLMFCRISGRLDGIVVGSDDCSAERTRPTTSDLLEELRNDF